MLHELVRRRILQARDMTRTPPSYAWMRAQPAGWVREIHAAWEADAKRAVYEAKPHMRFDEYEY